MTQIIIKKTFVRPEPETYQGLKNIPSSVLSDVCTSAVVFDTALKPMHQGFRLLGPALTVQLGYDSNLLLHKALELSRPGDVIVVDNAGSLSAAVFGELMSTVAIHKGVAGLVVDGLVRDSDKYGDIGFPIFARGALPRVVGNGPSSGSINLPIRCAGARVNPGDLIIGDDDGIIAIKMSELTGVAERATQKQEAETRRLVEIASGKHSPSWMAGRLAEAELVFLE